MLENFSFTSYVIDTDIKVLLKEELTKYNKILVISGEKSLKAFEKKLNYILENKLYSYKYYGGECSHSNVKKILDEISQESFDLVLGVGGGKAIDTGKLIAHKLNIPIITVPTIASTCASTSSLSVVYNDDGSFLEFVEFGFPPLKVFIDLETLKEVDLKYRYRIKNNISISYPNRLGKECSILCRELILKHAEQALFSKKIDDSFKKVVLAIIVNTGIVSNLIDEELNGAIAHSVCYGLGNIPSIEKNHLHGELVAFGILVQLLLEKNIEEYHTLLNLYRKLNFPTNLKKFIPLKEFEKFENNILDIILSSPDMPYLFKLGFQLERKNLKEVLYYNN